MLARSAMPMDAMPSTREALAGFNSSNALLGPMTERSFRSRQKEMYSTLSNYKALQSLVQGFIRNVRLGFALPPSPVALPA